MKVSKTKELLTLIEKNSRYDIDTLAGMLNLSSADVKKLIEELEEKKIIVK